MKQSFKRIVGWTLARFTWPSPVAAADWRRPRRWPVTAAVTLAAYLTATFSPLVAAAQEADAVADAERVDGGSLSSRADRARATAVGEGPAPVPARGSTGGDEPAGDDSGTEPPVGDVDGGTNGDGESNPDGDAPDDPNVVAQALPSGADMSGVTGQAISVPDGAGSIQGMGESFSAQLSTGVATFSVPFALSKARGGVQPSLGLSYNSGGGNGPVGQGWSVGVPFVARQTDRGLPKYDDRASWHAEQDRFVFNGGQELVPICTVEASLVCAGALQADAPAGEPAEVMPSWAAGWQYFRARVEGSFLRFFWSPDHLTWVVQDKSGGTMEIGVPRPANGPAPAGAAIASTRALERNPTRSSEIYAWHLSRQYDQHIVSGAPYNVVVYDYEQEGGTAYLVDIFEGSPSATPGTTDRTVFAHHTKLRWQARPDPTESYRSGWLKTQTRRLLGVDVSSKAYLDAVSATRHQVRRYHLSYDAGSHRSVLTSLQVEGRCVSSTGAAPVSETGAPSEDSNGQLPGQTSCGRLPPMTFSYSRVEGHQPNGDPDEGSLAGYQAFDGRVHVLSGSPNHSLDEALTDFFDVDSDGLADVLVTAPGIYGNDHAVFFQGVQGDDGFGGPVNVGVQGVLGANSNTITLKNQNVAPLDFDGDGRVNLLHMPKVATYSAYDVRRVDGLWKWVGREITTASGQSPKIDFGGDTTDTQVADVDFDGLVDVLVSTGTEYQTFLALGRHPDGDGQFGQGTRVSATASDLSNEPVRMCVPHSGLPVRLSDGETRLGDMNGDGITDLVKLQRGAIKYWPGRGNGFFGTGERDDCDGGTFGSGRHIEMAASPHYSDVSSTTVKLGDVNDDGLDDLVQVRFDSVDIWLNVDGKGWTATRHVLDDTPYHAGYHNRVRVADVDGSGTTDIVWGDAKAYKYIDLAGGTPSLLLVGVDNGLGKTTELEYQSSSEQMRLAEANGACTSSNDPATHSGVDPWSLGWCQKMPMVTQLVSRIIERDNIEIRGRPPAEYITEYEYRDPYFEGRQREFRGFGRARERRIGDVNSPTDVSESVFLLGECLDPADGSRWDGVEQGHYCAPPNRWADHPYEALKGLPVETHKLDAEGVHLSSTENVYRIRTLYEGLDGRAVRYAFLSYADTLLYDTSLGPQERVDIVRDGYEDFDRPQEEPGTPTPMYAAGMAHLRSQTLVDRFGNQKSSANLGCMAGPACTALVVPDETITQVSTPVLLSHGSGWMWRTSESYVQGSVQTTMRNRTRTTYDSLGRPTQVELNLSGTEALQRNNTSTVPSGAAPNGWFVQGTVAYDALGNAVRNRAVNGRCAQVSYSGGAYGLFPSSESIFTADTGAVTATTTACAGASLTASASYDMGLGAVVTALDMNLRPTQAHYDEFGRIRELYKPSATSAGVSALPSVVIEYQLPGCDGCLANSLHGGARHSLIHTKTHDGLTEATVDYLETYAYVDGLGRTLVTLSEADPASQDEAAWIAGSLLEWDQKGAVSKKFLGFFYSGDPEDFDYAGDVSTSYGRQRYDAFGRQVQTYDLDGTITLQSQYHSLSTDLWDAADLYAGEHQHTYASEQKDGHGRTVITTERFRKNGYIEQRFVETQYLPTGEPTVIRREEPSGQAVVRWMRYDTLGRMALNVEPNVSTGYTADPTASSASIATWRYLYNASGNLIGTSDARGCGQNFTYDGAGRMLAEDYAPCETHHAPYVAPTGSRDATQHEVTYYYDSSTTLPSGVAPSGWTGGSYTQGRAIAVLDRGTATFSRFDGRGRVVQHQKKVAAPAVLNASGQLQSTTLTARYAPRVYSRTFTYDAADREVSATTGAAEIVSGSTPVVPQVLAADNTSAVTTTYSRRGAVKASGSSYGGLVSDIRRGPDGLVHELKYGDAADTRTAYLYDERRRISSVQTYRGPPASGAWGTEYPLVSGADPDEPTRQLTLQDEDFVYDVVGNPVEIRDWRNPAEWPDGAKPVTRKIKYDDLNRAVDVRYEYADGDDVWQSPYATEVDTNVNNDDPRRARPAPHVSFAQRTLRQTFQYDWLGNSQKTTDDAGGFYDRSLGTIVNDTAGQNPYQLRSATLASGAGVTSPGTLQVRYNGAGYMTALGIDRGGVCLAAGTTDQTVCDQRFHYQWDEVGRLFRARRWDGSTGGGQTSVDSAVPSTTPAVDLRYGYDASDNRVVKQAVAGGASSYTVYVFNSLELRRTTYSTDYSATQWTVVPYLMANGVRLARVVYDPNADPTPTQSSGQPGYVSQSTSAAGNLYVFFELGDHLGSTSAVLDKATGELVQRSTFQAYGGTESDFRPERWTSFREDYRFTGKEEDAEVGLQYFGKRYLSPLLGRWISPDPLAVHAPGAADLNLYAYVRGFLLKATDPLGLADDACDVSSCVADDGVSEKTDSEAGDDLDPEARVCSGNPGECNTNGNYEVDGIAKDKAAVERANPPQPAPTATERAVQEMREERQLGEASQAAAQQLREKNAKADAALARARAEGRGGQDDGSFGVNGGSAVEVDGIGHTKPNLPAGEAATVAYSVDPGGLRLPEPSWEFVVSGVVRSGTGLRVDVGYTTLYGGGLLLRTVVPIGAGPEIGVSAGVSYSAPSQSPPTGGSLSLPGVGYIPGMSFSGSYADGHIVGGGAAVGYGKGYPGFNVDLPELTQTYVLPLAPVD